MTTPTNPNIVTTPLEKPLLSEQEARLRTELYIQQRIDYQDNFYRKRIGEFNYNADIMLWISAGLMGVSTILSSYSVISDEPIFAFFTALLPSIAAAVSAFRALYQWQRQAALYEDTWLALQQARLAMPDEDFLQSGDYRRYFPQLVRQTEEVLRNEASQWGQLERLLTEETEEETESSTPPTNPPPARTLYE